MKPIRRKINNNCQKMTSIFFSNLYTIDYRLKEYSVNEVIRKTKEAIENELREPFKHCSNKLFKKIIQALNLKKEFSTFVKERSLPEEVLHTSFLNNHVSELMRNINYWARIFETKEENRTNKKHKRHILKMLPYLKEIGQIAMMQDERSNITRCSNAWLKKQFIGNSKKQSFINV